MGGENQANALWEKEVIGKPTKLVLNKFQYINKFATIAKSEAASDLECCLAAILVHRFGVQPNHGCGFVGSFEIIDHINLKMAKLMQETPEQVPNPKATQKVVMAFLQDALKQAKDDNEKAEEYLQSNQMGYLTAGSRKTILVRLYLERNEKDIAATLTDFCKARQLNCSIEKEETVNWLNCKKALDKGIPVLLVREDGTHFVLLGYVMSNGENLLYAYNPKKASPNIVSGEDTLSEQDKKSNVPWIKKFAKYREGKKYYFDDQIDGDKPLPSCVELLTLKKSDKAFYVHDFKPNIEAMWEKLQVKLSSNEVNTGKGIGGQQKEENK